MWFDQTREDFDRMSAQHNVWLRENANAAHEWAIGIKAMVDRMDAEIAKQVYAEFYTPRPSPQGDGAGE